MKMKSRWITGNFVRFLTGRTLSVLGGNMLRFALSLYILEQTGYAAEYGTVLALGYVPTILLSVVLLSRVNSSNNVGRYSADMPTPVSLIVVRKVV